MKQAKIRVLVDLSMALLGYSGIPQDTRLLFKTLSLSPDVDVTGLLYPMLDARYLRHRFAPAGTPRSDRVANQSCFLWSMSQPPMGAGSRMVRAAQSAWRYAAARAARRAQTEPLDMDYFRHVLWRMLFAKTLPPEDLPLVEQGKFLLMNVTASLMTKKSVGNQRPIQLDTRGYDFLIVQTARPMRISPGTKQIVRYHDMIPVTQADTMSRLDDLRWHHASIRQSPESIFVCNSEPTRQNLIDVYPEIRDRSATIPYMLADTFWADHSGGRVLSILRDRRSGLTGAHPRKPLRRAPNYIMGVSTLEPRKNYDGLIQAFNTVRHRASMSRNVPNLKLVIVGSSGWKQEPILAAMRKLVAQGDIIHLESVTSEELRILYSHAEALVYPSHAEGFGFPPVEAMQCELPVIASDIPEHRWVLGDAALYCNSYDVKSIADAIERLLAAEDAPALRRQLVERGRQRVELYTLERCREHWLELLHSLQSGGRPATAPSLAGGQLNPGSMDRAA